MTVHPITRRDDPSLDAERWTPTAPEVAVHHGRHRERITVPDDVAAQFGIPLPVQVAATVWHDVVSWSDDIAARVKHGLARQTEPARLAELLTATRHALATSPWNSAAIEYVVLRVPPAGPIARALRVTLTVQLVNDRRHGPVFLIEHAYGDMHAQADKFTAPWLPAFPAPAWEIDAVGGLWPLVTVDLLDELLALADYEVIPRSDRRCVDVIPSRQRWPRAHGARLHIQGHLNLWGLQPLGWTFTRSTPADHIA